MKIQSITAHILPVRDPNKVPKIRTGATGFIGSAIFNYLVAGHAGAGPHSFGYGLTRSDMALVTPPASVKSPRKHDPSYVSRLVDLGPMPCFKDMNSGIPGLGSDVLGDANMKIGVGLSPNE